MPVSELKLIKRCAEFLPLAKLNDIPRNTRGIYVLLNEVELAGKFDVIYVGMARGQNAGVKGRLRRHKAKKQGKWTHFSVYEVWDNITEDEVAELEGLFRHIYRRDPKVNPSNEQRGFKKLKRVQINDLSKWRNGG